MPKLEIKRDLMKGILRKKGLLLKNERIIKLSSDGVLTYFHRDTPNQCKQSIDLTSQQVTSIRFEYAGRPIASSSGLSAVKNSSPTRRMRPKPHFDDEFRIYMQNRETFQFIASKLTVIPDFEANFKNPSIEKWEKAIKKFLPSSKVNIIFLH